MTDLETKKSRKTFILVVLAFVVPIVLAKIALTQKWFNYGVTNKGNLLANELTIKDLGLDKSEINEGWSIIYFVPADCSKSCEATLHGINNAHIALGKELPRVSPISLSTSVMSTEQQKLANSKYWIKLDNKTNLLNENKVWIADPLGNVMLSFEPPMSEDDVPTFGKAIVADLKKLLKYSKIG